jgi:hypothetical protein
VRRSLVVAEVALAVMTLSGAGMLSAQLVASPGEDLGFDRTRVLTAKVALLPASTTTANGVFYSQLEARLGALPGVRAAGASGWLPVVDAGGLWGFRPENGNYPEGRWPSAVPQQATPGYFAAAGLPLIAGRIFTNSDVDGAPLVAVVSKAFAELAWPGQDALGKRFGLATGSPFMTVIGIVGDIRARGFGDTPEPTMFFPLAQSAKSAYYMPKNMALLVRTSGDPALLAAAVRREIHALDPTVPVAEVRTLEQVAGTSVSTRRFNTSLLAGFAALALVLAGIGTYGVISYGVTQRTFEIGVRIALGADTRSVLSLVMSEGMLLAGTGLLLGLGASLAVARFIRAMLVGVPALDPPSLIATAGRADRGRRRRVGVAGAAGVASQSHQRITRLLVEAETIPLDELRTRRLKVAVRRTNEPEVRVHRHRGAHASRRVESDFARALRARATDALVDECPGDPAPSGFGRHGNEPDFRRSAGRAQVTVGSGLRGVEHRATDDAAVVVGHDALDRLVGGQRVRERLAQPEPRPGVHDLRVLGIGTQRHLTYRLALVLGGRSNDGHRRRMITHPVPSLRHPHHSVLIGVRPHF